MNISMQKGITMLEVLVAISILIVLTLIVFPQFSKMKENQVLKNSVEEVVSALRNAQARSLASVNSGEFGVHFQSDKVIIFSGKTYDEGNGENKSIDIIPPANISNIILAGASVASGDIYFARLSGDPNKSASVTVSTTSNSKTITVSLAGVISVN